MPLQGHRIIHPQFTTWTAPTVLAMMPSRVRLWRPGGMGPQDPDSGRTPVLDPVAYYEGPGRIQARGAMRIGSSGDRTPAIGNFLVAVPVEAGDTQLQDLVEVLQSWDPLLVAPGERLVVVDVPTADIILQRNLGCDRQTDSNRRG